ncbi:MAG: lytic transglycosylase domain-containing protein [Sphingomonadales bacterium]
MHIVRFAILLVSLAVVFQNGPLAQTTAASETNSTADFDRWLEGLRAEAEAAGIGKEILSVALSGLEPIPRVIELDRHQPEFTQTFTQYLAARLSRTRIERGQRMMAENKALLTRVAEQYEVQPRFIAAIWGLETNYGSFMGGYPVIGALATLAFDGRRSTFFRKELLNALKVLDEGHIGFSEMLGSWAGAMGQSQFMPSSFLTFARDQDGDGRADIWGNRADVFASIANYLARHGWSDDQTWGREVKLPPGFGDRLAELKPGTQPKSCRRALKHHTVSLSLPEWQALGVRRADGRDLPDRALQATLVMPQGTDGPAYLTYRNYRSILRYNCSNFYAIAVGALADRIAR